MGALLNFLTSAEEAFNKRFGWFFTNGNKSGWSNDDYDLI